MWLCCPTKTHKFVGVSPTLAQHHEKSWINMGSDLQGCAYVKSNPLSLKYSFYWPSRQWGFHYVEMQALQMWVFDTSLVTRSTEPFQGMGDPQEPLWNLPCGSDRLNLSLCFVHLRNCNQIFISLAVTKLHFGFLEKPACSCWSNQGITGDHMLNKMLF